MKKRHALCVCSSSSTQTADSHRVHARTCHCVHFVHYATSSYNTLHIQQPYSRHAQALTFLAGHWQAAVRLGLFRLVNRALAEGLTCHRRVGVLKKRHALCVCSSSSTQTADSHRVHARTCHCVHFVHYATSSYNTLHIQQPYSRHAQALTFLAGHWQAAVRLGLFRLVNRALSEGLTCHPTSFGRRARVFEKEACSSRMLKLGRANCGFAQSSCSSMSLRTLRALRDSLAQTCLLCSGILASPQP